MPREPKPFLHRGWYKTDIQGQRHKLCREAEGFNSARIALARLIVKLADGEEGAATTPPASQGFASPPAWAAPNR